MTPIVEYMGLFAEFRKQAGVTFRYVLGLLKSVTELEALIENEKAESGRARSPSAAPVVQ